VSGDASEKVARLARSRTWELLGCSIHPLPCADCNRTRRSNDTRPSESESPQPIVSLHAKFAWTMLSLCAKYVGHGEKQDGARGEGPDGCLRGGIHRARPSGASADPAHAELQRRIDDSRRDRRRVRACLADHNAAHPSARVGWAAPSREGRPKSRVPHRSSAPRTRSGLARVVFEGPH
jgi:hypothetical protein